MKFRAIVCVFCLVTIQLLMAGLSWAVPVTYVDDDYDAGTPGWNVTHFDNITTGIFNVDVGGTVNVYAGTYTEQLTIQKSLSLIGAGRATTTIQAPAAPRSGYIPNTGTDFGLIDVDYVVGVYPASGTINVRVEGFTIDANGEDKSAGRDAFVGAVFQDVDGASAGLYSCAVNNFGSDAANHGVRVYWDSDLTIDDNIVSGYAGDGIGVWGDGNGDPDPVALVSNNSTTGSATTRFGIFVGYTDNGVTVSNNGVTGHTDSSNGHGIYVFDADNVVIDSGNVIKNCYRGIRLYTASSCTIDGNILTNNSYVHISIENSSDSNTVSANTITGTAGGLENAGIKVYPGTTGNTIGGPTPADGNTITLQTVRGPGALLYVIYFGGAAGGGSNTVQNNKIYGGWTAIQQDGSFSGTNTFSDNIIGNVGPSFAGIFLNGGNAIASGNVLTNSVRPFEFWGPVNVTITGNVINGSTFDGVNCGSASGAISISGNTFYNLPVGVYAIHGRGGADNIVIDDNEIYNSDRGIIIDSTCTGCQITRNNIHDNGFVAIELHEAVNTITSNTLDNNWRGIETWNPFTANYNQITNHAFGGVILHGAGPHNAEFNWWGDASGPNYAYSGYPGTGTPIQPNIYSVDYSPWWGYSSLQSPMLYGVSTDGTIQEGVDAATGGDSVSVAYGTYSESVSIGKALTVFSMDYDEVTTLSIPSASHGVVIAAEPVTVQGLRIEGAETGYDGIRIDGVAGVAIEECTLRNNDTAIELVNDAAPTVSDCFIYDNNTGIDNPSITETATALNCYWGRASGPTGSDVVGSVTVSPWAYFGGRRTPVGTGGGTFSLNAGINDRFTRHSLTIPGLSQSGYLKLVSPSDRHGVDNAALIEVGGGLTGNATVSIEYDPATDLGGYPEEWMRLARWTGSDWEFLSSTVDTFNDTVSGQVSSFSILSARPDPALGIADWDLY